MVIKIFLKSKTGAFDYLVLGLGNPGLQYENTRHNAGFMAADRIAEKFGCDFGKKRHDALFGECVIAGRRVILAKPQTYMNNSGAAATKLSTFYKIPVDKIIVMFDDVSLDPGKLRIRPKGSDGGHRGMRDIIELCGTDKIVRVKIGVGSKPHPEYDMKDWVLGRFGTEDKKLMDGALDRVVDAVSEIISKGTASAMNKFNG